MSKIKTAFSLLLHNRNIFLSTILNHFSFLFNDKQYISLQYRLRMGEAMNWESPKSFTEKLQWLKLYNRNPLYSQMVDKYAVKSLVAKQIGEQYIIPTLGVWDRVEDIDWDKLPNQFVLKTTHGGGGSGVVIIRDKATTNINEVEKKLRKALKQKIYKYNREWPYKNVKPRILAEKYMVDESGYELKDYKLFCFNGEVKFLKVDFNRQTNHQANYLKPDWTLLPFGEEAYPPDINHILNKPSNFEEMLRLAKELAKDIPFARIDFYSIRGRNYFGEMTFFPAGGFGTFTPKETDIEIGKLLTLPCGGGYLIDCQQVIVYIHPDYDRHIDLIDYKFFCFDGVPKYCQVIRDRHNKETIDFYDLEWVHQDFVGLNPVARNGLTPVARPDHLDEMIEICRHLSKGIPFIRVDLYMINKEVYFGELTFFPAGGFGCFTPRVWDEKMGNLITLPGKQLLHEDN